MVIPPGKLHMQLTSNMLYYSFSLQALNLASSARVGVEPVGSGFPQQWVADHLVPVKFNPRNLRVARFPPAAPSVGRRP
jgi:hypothetical protein